MANSSSWIEQVGSVPSAQPGWLAALEDRGGFQPGLPSSHPATEPMVEPAESGPADDAITQALAEGEAAGKAAAQAELARLRELRANFRAFDQAALDALASELCDTVIALCEQVLEASAINRDGLIERCHWAARRLGGAAAQSTLHLHPEDIALLGEDSLADWQVEPDPTVARGSLLLEGPDGAVRDGPAEWRRAIAEAVRG